ncbi:MAG TPA: hypothetical protein VLA15_06605 [Desulfurivibrionaceae bacterium]|nr:hypothetical protein [Desulfurivibrionaceae bacterium]
MREDEVPQDQGIAEGLKEVTYAVDATGHYKLVPSAGWEPKNISNYQAWEVVAAQVAEARQAVLAGRVSPLAFHMARNQMDTALLAQYMGLPRWRVWLHLRPWGFRRLTMTQLQGYAAMLRTTVPQLQDISMVAEMRIPGREAASDAD